MTATPAMDRLARAAAGRSAVVPKQKPQCGTAWSYSSGCHCPDCTAAHREVKRAYRARRRAREAAAR